MCEVWLDLVLLGNRKKENDMYNKNVINGASEVFNELRIAYASDEVWTGADYYWDNQQRNLEHVIIQLTMSGHCFLDADGARHIVTPGEAFITEVPSGTIYGYPDETSEPYELRFLALHGKVAVDFARSFRSQFGPILNLSSQPESASLFREIFERYTLNTYRDRYEESTQLLQLFAALYREATQDAVRDDAVATCYHRIQTRYRESANINEIARDVGVSREHLARSFQRRYGQSPARMLRDMRVREARMVIESGVEDLEGVARAVGFSDVRTLKRYL